MSVDDIKAIELWCKGCRRWHAFWHFSIRGDNGRRRRHCNAWRSRYVVRTRNRRAAEQALAAPIPQERAS